VLHSLYGQDHFTEGCMSLLKKIIHETGAVIVLSSTWRTSQETTRIVNENLAKYGIQPCVSSTPDYGWQGTRTKEILWWVDQNDGVASWVALDDMDLTFPSGPEGERMKPHFVHTRSERGLTEELAAKAIGILDGTA